MKKILVALLSVSAMSFAGASEGKSVYTAKCQACHGPDGVAKDSMQKMLKAEIKPLGTQSDAEIKEIVTKGRGKMKPIGGLTDAQVNDVAAYVKTLKH